MKIFDKWMPMDVFFQTFLEMGKPEECSLNPLFSARVEKVHQSKPLSILRKAANYRTNNILK